MNSLRLLTRWDHGFESHSRHGCLLYAFILCFCCPVLTSGLATSWSLVQGDLPYVKKMITKLNKRPGPWMGWKSHWKKIIWQWVKIIKLLDMQIFTAFCCFRSLKFKHSFQCPVFNTQFYVVPPGEQVKIPAHTKEQYFHNLYDVPIINTLRHKKKNLQKAVGNLLTNLLLLSRKPKLKAVGIRCADHAKPSIR
jgi:hypothetical protein